MRAWFNQIRYKSMFFLFQVFKDYTTDIPYIFNNKQFL